MFAIFLPGAAAVSTEDFVFKNLLTLKWLKSSTIFITYRLPPALSDSIGPARSTYSKAAHSGAWLSAILGTAYRWALDWSHSTQTGSRLTRYDNPSCLCCCPSDVLAGVGEKTMYLHDVTSRRRSRRQRALRCCFSSPCRHLLQSRPW